MVKQVLLKRPDANMKPVQVWLFFAGAESELAKANELILDFPGGGFVSMGPRHHEERLRRWAIQTGKPVLAVNYSKAPECMPFHGPSIDLTSSQIRIRMQLGNASMFTVFSPQPRARS
jgi:acetyl esterase/lipase